ncbi:MAG: Gfo/Idh/MocA family oxidoreductase [Planctomycetota bacterium]|nr:Gfo/Idh/MocA family oxidoreductase [Planctomycetota bacterium]
MSNIRVAVAGLGYWGPVLARNFASHPNTELAAIVDIDSDKLEKAKDVFKNVPLFTELEDAFDKCDAVAVATPVSTHYRIAKQCLQEGKHVFVEKPITKTSAEARELLDIARRKDLVIGVDHILIYHGMVQKVKEILDSGELGEILYFNASRANLGLFQSDEVNVIWDLGPHDFSLMLYFLGEPKSIMPPAGAAHYPAGLVDDVHLHFRYTEKLIASIYLSWLSPLKQRMTVIGGSKKMLVFSDLWQGEEIRLYDHGVEAVKEGDSWRYDYRRGGIVIPEISRRQPLGLEIDEFSSAILNGSPVISDGEMGLKIVRMLEECDSSFKHNNGN